MNNRLQKQEFLEATIMVVLLVAGLLCSLPFLLRIDYQQYDNEASFKVSHQVNQINAGQLVPGKYPYMVMDTESVVQYADSIFQLKVGEIVNPQEYLTFSRSQENKYTGYTKNIQLIRQDKKVTGYGIFLVPNDEFGLARIQTRVIKALWPMYLAMILVGILLLWRAVRHRRRMYQPMNEIALSAKEMILGNYEREVLRTYELQVGENEMGNLLYSFELMRDELKDKQMSTERLRKEQQELISCISHDLRTPISTIKAYCEGIRDGMAKDEKAKQEYINIIIEKTDTLTGMIKDLLEVSNAELQKLDIVRNEHYFIQYVEPVLKELTLFARNQQATLTYEIEATEFLYSFDEKRLTEVFYNLVENSLKYRGKNPLEITVNITKVDNVLMLVFRDNGAGIQAEDVPYVFDKFYRGEKSRSSTLPGSGLGLAICKYIIEAHDGIIYCTSAKDQGFEIGIRLDI